MDDYFSDSTIDNEPKSPFGEDDDGQMGMFPEKEQNHDDDTIRKFNIDLKLTLTPAGGKSIAVPLLSDSCQGTVVMERIMYALESPRNKRIIEAILDNPEPKAESESEVPPIDLDSSKEVM